MKLKIFLLILVSTFSVFAQQQSKEISPASKTDESRKIARKVYQAHGGENLKKIKSIVISGAADLTSTEMTLPMTGSFAMIIEGEKARFDLKMPFFSFTQVYNGKEIDTSMPGVFLPPLSEFGFAVIPHFTDENLTIAKNDQSKTKGFYVTTSNRYTTTFEIDEKTGLVKSYKSVFEFNGATQETAVEIEKWQEVEKILLPEAMLQRFNFGSNNFYLKAKTIRVNAPIATDVFVLGSDKSS
jgi:hypothetical protein